MKLKSNLAKLDKLLLITSLLLFVLGLVIVFSSSTVAAVLAYKESSYFFVVRQAGVEIGMFIIAVLFIINIPTKDYNIISKAIPWIMLGLLIAVRLFGVETNGAKSWIPIGGYNFQASEFCKTLTIIFIATYYGEKKKWPNQWSLIWPLAIPLGCVLLIAREPDLGTAIILFGIIGMMFLSLPIKKGQILRVVIPLGIAAVGIIYMLFQTGNLEKAGIINPQQASRFHFTKPCERYLEKTGYQVCNGYIAINNGGLYGLGLGNSKQKNLYLPEAYTDFIFPIIVEEFGLIGTGVLFFGYMLLLFSILTIARHASNLRNSLLAYGTFAYILIHLMVNLLGVTGLFIMTGVPLPFMSYGGSFVMNLIILLALTQRVAIENKMAKLKKA